MSHSFYDLQDFAGDAGEFDADASFARVAPKIPRYLQDVYWWAYVHPNAVRVFERQWLVNAILWGNYARLRDAALDGWAMRCRGERCR